MAKKKKITNPNNGRCPSGRTILSRRPQPALSEPATSRLSVVHTPPKAEEENLAQTETVTAPAPTAQEMPPSLSPQEQTQQLPGTSMVAVAVVGEDLAALPIPATVLVITPPVDEVLPPAPQTTLAVVEEERNESAATALVKDEGPTDTAADAQLVLNTRNQMRQTMSRRLADMMASLRDGVQAELLEMSVALQTV